VRGPSFTVDDTPLVTSPPTTLVWQLPQFGGWHHFFKLTFSPLILTSLLLINSHVSSYEAIPQVPNTIEIGGFHIEEPKKLPDHLQKFFDESTNGVLLTKC
jgi:hypothetical protein